MKINVIPEWREDIYEVKKEEIIKYIKWLKQKHIHNMSWWWNMMIWADWNKNDVIETIKESNRVAILLWKAKGNNMWHSLAVIVWNKLEIFDIEIDKDNLITN